MKLHSLRLVTLALAWVIFGSASTAPEPAVKKADPAYYYWYFLANDSFLFYQNTTNEITDLENTLGVSIDTGPWGTPVAAGYMNNVYPHNVYPSVILYGHF